MKGRQAGLKAKYTLLLKQQERRLEVPLDKFCRKHVSPLPMVYYVPLLQE